MNIECFENSTHQSIIKVFYEKHIRNQYGKSLLHWLRRINSAYEQLYEQPSPWALTRANTNHLGQMVRGRRALPEHMARAVAMSMGLDGDAQERFVALVELEVGPAERRLHAEQVLQDIEARRRQPQSHVPSAAASSVRAGLSRACVLHVVSTAQLSHAGQQMLEELVAQHFDHALSTRYMLAMSLVPIPSLQDEPLVVSDEARASGD